MVCECRGAAACIVAAALLLAMVGAKAAAPPSRGPVTANNVPSFLFLLGDDIGWGDFGYNNGTALTPNIDAWAR